MYRLRLHGLYGLYGPHCLLSPERPLNLITHPLTHPDWCTMKCFLMSILVKSDCFNKTVLYQYIAGLVQERRNSSALAMELRISCTNLSILPSQVPQCYLYPGKSPSSTLCCHWEAPCNDTRNPAIQIYCNPWHIPSNGSRSWQPIGEMACTC